MAVETEIAEKLEAHRAEKQKSQEITVEQSELDSLTKLQKEMDTIIVAFGRLAIEELAHSNQKGLAEQALKDIKVKEQEMAKALTDKYGTGSLNIATGKFTTTPKE